MNEKHTPGPYFACSADGGNAINIECKGDGNDSFPIATLKGPDRKANGALFAAAPDMLEVLQTILKRFDLEPVCAVFPCSAMRKDIRAVIALAGGGE